MSQFVENPTHFSAECWQREGQCSVTRKNIIFLDNGKEQAAVDYLQKKCGYVVIIPDASNRSQAWLYHTSCDRMTDVIKKIFQDQLQPPEPLTHRASEMSLGELHRRGVAVSYDNCRQKVESFRF